MDISIIFSIIGCITGLLSIIIASQNHLFQKGEQKFNISQQKASYYFPASDTTVRGCWKPTYCAVISLKATNKSSYPITIDDAVIKKDNFSARHYSEFSFDYIYVKESYESEICKDPEPNANLPLKLAPFETKYFSFAFPFFESFISNYGEDINVELIISTPLKEHKMLVTIPEYYGLFENLSNNSLSNSDAGCADNT